MGLGLAVVKHIAELHGWRVTAMAQREGFYKLSEEYHKDNKQHKKVKVNHKKYKWVAYIPDFSQVVKEGYVY